MTGKRRGSGQTEVRFERHHSGVRWGRMSPWAMQPRGHSAIGAPSAELSLGGLLASRAHLRFTRRPGCTATAAGKQEQAAQQDNQQTCHGHEGWTGCSEGSLVFCLYNGVHLTIRRVKDGWNQVARTGVPQIDGKCWVWKGDVTGDGLDAPLPFDLHIPR